MDKSLSYKTLDGCRSLGGCGNPTCWPFMSWTREGLRSYWLAVNGFQWAFDVKTFISIRQLSREGS